jgi:uncharacterized protein YcfJ
MSNKPKNLLLIAAALAAAGLPLRSAWADEWARVISSTPVMQQVAVPQQVCSEQPVVVGAPRTGAGAVMGALAGGAVGNAIGGGLGRAAATLLGIVGGAALGDQIEGRGAAQVQNMTQCSTQTVYENRPVAWNVVYEYAGRQYSTQMAEDPGPNLRIQIGPVGAAPAADPAYAPAYGQAPAAQPAYPPTYANPAPVYAPQVSAQPVYTQPVYAQPVYTPAAPVVVAPAAPVAYAAPGFVWPAGLSVGLGYVGGHGGHGRGYVNLQGAFGGWR